MLGVFEHNIAIALKCVSIVQKQNFDIQYDLSWFLTPRF